jgi:hypothetical protein
MFQSIHLKFYVYIYRAFSGQLLQTLIFYLCIIIIHFLFLKQWLKYSEENVTMPPPRLLQNLLSPTPLVAKSIQKIFTYGCLPITQRHPMNTTLHWKECCKPLHFFPIFLPTPVYTCNHWYYSMIAFNSDINFSLASIGFFCPVWFHTLQ